MNSRKERINQLAQLVREFVDDRSLGRHIDCEVKGNVNKQWVQVILASNALDQQRERKIIGVLLGFPFPFEEKPFKVLEKRGVDLPNSVGLCGWRPNKSATLHVGLRHSECEIAEWIDQLLTRVLGADEDHELQVRYSWKSPQCDHVWPPPASTQADSS